MNRVPTYSLLCILFLLGLSSGLAQLSPVVAGVQDVINLTCGDDAPSPDYASVLVDPDCASASLTAEDRVLCQHYKVYEVQTPPYDESIEQEDWAWWLGGATTTFTTNFEWDDQRSRLFVSDTDAFLLGYASNIQEPDKVFELYLELENGIDYEGWNSQLTTMNPGIPRSYRDTYGYAIEEELWNSWSYYETNEENSYLTGENLFLGSSSSVSHAPSNYLFGFQLGEAANNHNENFGFNTWATINGLLEGEPWNGQSDFDGDAVLLGTVGELYCADVVIRTWTATDACGHVSRSSQVIETSGGPYLADINADGTIGLEDFLNFNTAFGSTCDNCPEDLNGNGVVNIEDFLLFNSYFGSQCE